MEAYIVTVRVHILEYYEVDAETADEAMDLWQDGKFVGANDYHLEAEPLNAKAKGARP
jgi:hypothetical protein